MDMVAKKIIIAATAVVAVVGGSLYVVYKQREAYLNSLEANLASQLADEVEDYRKSERHLRLVAELRKDVTIPLEDMMRKIQLDIAFNVLPSVETTLETHRSELSASEFNHLTEVLRHMVMRIIAK